jgi:hypothetical protein
MKNEKAEAVRTMHHLEVLKIYPDLVKAIAVIQASEALLEKHITHPEVMKQALQNIKNTVAKRIEEGLTLPIITIRESKAEDSQPEFDYAKF